MNYWLKNFDTLRMIKVTKVLKPANDIAHFKTLGTTINYNPMSSPSLDKSKTELDATCRLERKNTADTK